MDTTDNRLIARDSLLLLAGLRIDGLPEVYRIKVRNLSAGGMMGESELEVERGANVRVELRNIGWIEGSIAWVQGNRFGVAFAKAINPKLAREPLVDGEHTPRYVRPPLPSPDHLAFARKY